MSNVKRFLATKAVKRTSGGRTIVFDKEWGLSSDEYVDVTIRRADMSDEPIYVTKKLCKIGMSTGIFLKKMWGFDTGDLLTISVERRKDAIGRFTEYKERMDAKVIESGASKDQAFVVPGRVDTTVIDRTMPRSPAFDVPSMKDKEYKVPKVEDLMYDDLGNTDQEGN